MACTCSMRICHMLSVPLTSCLSIYISDKPDSKALFPLLPPWAPDERQHKQKIDRSEGQLTQGSDK